MKYLIILFTVLLLFGGVNGGIGGGVKDSTKILKSQSVTTKTVRQLDSLTLKINLIKLKVDSLKKK